MAILRPDLADPEKEEIFEKLRKKIESLEGTVSVAKVWEKERGLHFFLRSRGAEKKKYYKGCYWLVAFNLDTEKLLDFKETIRLEERILRSLITNRQDKLKD